MAKHEETFQLVRWENGSEAKEINCEQTEILTALIMAKNRDSARSGAVSNCKLQHVQNLKL